MPKSAEVGRGKTTESNPVPPTQVGSDPTQVGSGSGSGSGSGNARGTWWTWIKKIFGFGVFFLLFSSPLLAATDPDLTVEWFPNDTYFNKRLQQDVYPIGHSAPAGTKMGVRMVLWH